MTIGKKLKQLRKSKGLTLVQLSEQSGVQVATLSRIENLKMTGTLESHMAIAKVLGIDVTQLYTDIIREGSPVESSKQDQTTDVFVHSNKSSYEILTKNVLSKKMMPVLLNIEPKGKTNFEEFKAGAERFIYVLQGDIQVAIGQDTYRLSVGHTLYLDASLRHNFENLTDKTAKVICITTPVTL